MSSTKLRMIMALQLTCLVLAMGYAVADVGTPFLLRFSVVFMFIFVLNWVVTESLREISDRLEKLEGKKKGGEEAAE